MTGARCSVSAETTTVLTATGVSGRETLKCCAAAATSSKARITAVAIRPGLAQAKMASSADVNRFMPTPAARVRPPAPAGRRRSQVERSRAAPVNLKWTANVRFGARNGLKADARSYSKSADSEVAARSVTSSPSTTRRESDYPVRSCNESKLKTGGTTPA
jgi:hypothetical protein